ncbi:hypothetical protein I3760_03G248300 [Carya illinoinensis]|nr:hypothetical protein I3760_03G248300 [Carya illinoinensis]KAG2719035.1 hypothetical protein I3760_03G248300 [Carya illinoinensis]
MALNRTLLLQPSSLSTRRTTRNFVCIIPKIPFSNLRIPSLAPPSSTNRCLQLRCSVDHKDPQQYSNNTQVAYPKPTEIPWSKELSNTVNLIGIVGTPSRSNTYPLAKPLLDAPRRQEVRLSHLLVIVQQLNFVVRSLSSSPLYDHDSDSMTAGKKLGNIAASNVGSVKELWQPFFANPVDWWDNRKNKKNPKYPDFKHKDTGEALWVEGRYNPP